MRSTARDRAIDIVSSVSELEPSCLQDVRFICGLLGYTYYEAGGTGGTVARHVNIRPGDAPVTSFHIDALSLYWIGDGDVRINFTQR